MEGSLGRPNESFRFADGVGLLDREILAADCGLSCDDTEDAISGRWSPDLGGGRGLGLFDDGRAEAPRLLNLAIPSGVTGSPMSCLFKLVYSVVR